MKFVSACLLGAYFAFATAAFAQTPEDVELEQFRQPTPPAPVWLMFF